jgi:hypothetical protein
MGSMYRESERVKQGEKEWVETAKETELKRIWNGYGEGERGGRHGGSNVSREMEGSI